MPISNEFPSLTIIFPDLRMVMNQLYEFLQSDLQMEFRLDHRPYQMIFNLLKSKSDSQSSSTELSSSFIDFAYEAVLPSIKQLQGQEITLSTLQNVRLDQIKERSIWNPPHGGYLDFTTDQRFHDYWRPFVGQSTEPSLRIMTHHSRIQARSTDCLHYWILSRDGSRVANFIRLWTFPFPEGMDSRIQIVFENFLEKTMCRAFQSLPPLTLKEVFGPCPDAQEYSGMGLNVISPLY